MRQVIGVDIGGTALKLGRFLETGECIGTLTIPTPQPPYPQPVLSAVAAAIATLDPHQEGAAIGVGTPGPTDITARIARIAINLPDWLDVPVADWLESQLQRPVVVANDANCAGLGELWLGAGRTFQNLVLLTLGTGVGGCIILNRQLFVGQDGAAGELGLVTVNLDGPPCQSGNAGSLEQYASAQAIRRQTGLEPAEMAAKAQAGDESAIAFWQHYGRHLGAGLVSTLYVLNPEAVILGGGISAAAEFFLAATQAEVYNRIQPSYRHHLQIVTAELGNRAGMVGAAHLALQKLGTGGQK